MAQNQQYIEKITATGNWIDKDFLKDVIDNTLEDDVDIIDFKIQPAVGKGENYLSIIYKTTVKYTSISSDKTQIKNLMIKGLPSEEILQGVIHQSGIFTKEITFYREGFPLMRRDIRRFYPKDTPQIVPDNFLCSRPDTLVMEDLVVDGYKMANRHDQLDFEHTEVVLQTVARFHALTHKLHRDRPDLVEKIAKELYTTGGEKVFMSLTDQALPVLESLIDSWEEVSRFGATVRKIHKNYFKKLLEIVKPKDGFNVINHGDLWINNVMFKYDQHGSVESAKLVDFQVTRFTTPALDLLYLFLTSVQPKVLTEKMFDLVEFYHSALIEDCTTLHMEVDYPIENLHEDLRTSVTFGYMAMVQIAPVILAPVNSAVEINENEAEENILTKTFRNPAYRKHVCQIIPFLDSISYLEDAHTRMRYVEEAAEEKAVADEEQRGHRSLVQEEEEEKLFTEKSPSEEKDMFYKFWRFITQPVCH